jgi:ribA/ribD-fused uncharacterized protein
MRIFFQVRTNTTDLLLNSISIREHGGRLVTEGNIAKFEQNGELRAFLVGTGNLVLVEASPYNRIWGIRLMADDERSKNPATWQGQTLLGFALMDVRDKLV